MLDTLFMTVLDMTVKGSIVILAVLAARLLLRRAPRVISYGLWLVVLIRLLCPANLPSPVSILPEVTPVSQDYVLEDVPVSIVQVGATAVEIVGNAISGENTQQEIYVVTPEVTPDASPDISPEMKYISVSPKDIWIHLGMYLWAGGMAVMAVYSVVSLLRLKRKLREAVRMEKGVYETDTIASPFVIGLFVPKIYLPVGLEEQERGYILAHERHHIRRIDPVWKALGFFALCIHWFNPLVWLAFFLGCRDMEMSCDEAVLKQLGGQIRPEYAASLLKISTGKAIVGGTPLAFGEGDTKGRIKNLSKWKKPVLWISIVAVLLCGVLAVTLLTDPVHQEEEPVGVTWFFGEVEKISETGVTIRMGDKTREFPVDKDTETSEDLKPGTYVKVRGTWDTAKKNYRAAAISRTVEVAADDLNTAAEWFIEELDRKYVDKNQKTVASFKVLGRRVAEDGCVTLYGLALQMTYANRNGSVKEVGGSYIPAALTFTPKGDGAYTAVEYWMPRDGSLYAGDVRAKFPGGQIPDTQIYIMEQERECLKKALSHFDMLHDEVVSPTEPTENKVYGFDMSKVPDNGIKPFEELSREYYELVNVIQDGAVVMEHESGCANVDVWYEFVRLVESGTPAKVRVVNYRLGILMNAEDIFFDGKYFLVRQQMFFIDGTPGEILDHYYYHLKSFRGVLRDKSGETYESYVRYGLQVKPTGTIEPDWEDSEVSNRLVFQIRQEYKINPQISGNLVCAKLMLEDTVFGSVYHHDTLASLENMIAGAELVPDAIREFMLDELYLLLQYEDGTELRLAIQPEMDWILIGDLIYDYGPGEEIRGDKIMSRNALLKLVRHFGLEEWPREFSDWCMAHGMEPPGHSLKVLCGEEPHHH